MRTFELTSDYLIQIKHLIKTRQKTPYDLAHASFRKNNADVIIKHVDRKNLVIKFLDGSVEQFKPTRKKLFYKYIDNLNYLYTVARKAYISRYFDIINKYNHRHNQNTIGSIVSI